MKFIKSDNSLLSNHVLAPDPLTLLVDVMDRLPAVSPFLQHLGGDFLCYKVSALSAGSSMPAAVCLTDDVSATALLMSTYLVSRQCYSFVV